MDDPYPIQVLSRSRRHLVDAEKVTKLAALALARLGVGDRELNVTFVASRAIRSLNREYRGKDKATDVLSFPQETFPAPLRVKAAAPKKAKRAGRGLALAPPQALGDVVISLPDALRNARAIGQGLDREVAFLLVHGILHLCGHDHMTPAEERRMLTEQRKLMRLVGTKWRGCVKAARA